MRRQAKRLCKPRGTRGEDFCLLGIAMVELPVKNYQVKPDRFQPNFFPLYFISTSEINQILIFRFQNRPIGCGVAVAEGIKAFTVNDCSDFIPQPNKLCFFYF